MATMEISAKDVFKLRQQTGAGMMDCKKALAEVDGDFDAAVDVLRKQGQKVASKRADRDATEGFVLAKAIDNDTKALIITLNCETDFVAKNEDFGKLVEQFAQVAIDNKVTSLDELKSLEFSAGITVADKIIEQTGVIGEKLDLSYFELVEGAQVVAYNHPGNRIASIAAANEKCDESVLKDIAMQIAAMSPVALNKEGVSSELIEKELEIAKDLLRQEGKPEEMIEKIAVGKLNKFFKESTLLNQAFIKDGKKSVEQYLKEASPSLTISNFKRYSLGE